MPEPTAVRTVVIGNEQGLHARPADMFVRTAMKFSAKVAVVKGSLRVDGKSILDVLTLGATKDTELILEATGTDVQILSGHSPRNRFRQPRHPQFSHHH